jgi:release factor glutamine methyltransferase
MKVREALSAARDEIATRGSDEAFLEAEVLVRHVLGIDRVRLYQRMSDRLSKEQASCLQGCLERRSAHEPVAYIIGRKEFFGLEFEVSPTALIPRPETETLVERALEFAREYEGRLTIVDVGTGTGAIGICLAKTMLNARVVATDVSREAIELARRNAERHGILGRIGFRVGDLLAPVGELVEVIAANLPYVTTEQWEALPPEIRNYEPRGALDGGADGLEYVRRLFDEAPAKLADGGALFCEIGDWQGDAAREVAQTAFPGARVEVSRDLAGRDRVVCVYA